MDRLDRSQVEIEASRGTRTGFITLDHSCKKNPTRPQIEASRRKPKKCNRFGFSETTGTGPALSKPYLTLMATIHLKPHLRV